MSTRSIGKATISFGLISVPIKVFSAKGEEAGMKFSNLSPDGNRLKQQYVDSVSGTVVPWAEFQKGFEHEPNKFLIFSKDEVKALQAESDHTIAINEFVPSDTVPTYHIEQTQYLGPDKGGARGYRLLAEAMTKTGLVGVGKWNTRGKEHLVVIRPINDHQLILEDLFYAGEVKNPSEVEIEDATVSKAELDLATELLNKSKSVKFDITKYEDGVLVEFQDIVKKKLKGEVVIVAPKEGSKAPTVDLMEALKASLGSAKVAAGSKGTAKAKK